MSAACHPLPDKYYQQFHTFDKHFDGTADKKETATLLTTEHNKTERKKSDSSRHGAIKDTSVHSISVTLNGAAPVPTA